MVAGSLTGKYYRSEPAPGDYPLKAKYRQGWLTAPRHNKHSDNMGKSRTRIRIKNQPPPEPRFLVMKDAYRGKLTLMTEDQYRAWCIKSGMT